MKAYLSTHGRRCYPGKGDIFAGITPTRSTDQKARMAESEARRILADAEPHEVWRENSLGFPCYLRCRAANMEPWNVGAALAESLARFIALPIE